MAKVSLGPLDVESKVQIQIGTFVLCHPAFFYIDTVRLKSQTPKKQVGDMSQPIHHPFKPLFHVILISFTSFLLCSVLKFEKCIRNHIESITRIILSNFPFCRTMTMCRWSSSIRRWEWDWASVWQEAWTRASQSL